MGLQYRKDVSFLPERRKVIKLPDSVEESGDSSNCNWPKMLQMKVGNVVWASSGRVFELSEDGVYVLSSERR